MFKKMHLDVDMSPPANDITFRLGLTHLTFDLDPCDFWSSHRQMDRWTDGQKAMHMSPLCIRTGGLKNVRRHEEIFFHGPILFHFVICYHSAQLRITNGIVLMSQPIHHFDGPVSKNSMYHTNSYKSWHRMLSNFVFTKYRLTRPPGV